MNDRYRLYSEFPDVRFRVTGEERLAMIAAAEKAGLPLGVWFRNLALAALGRPPRIVQKAGSGTREQGRITGRRVRADRTLTLEKQVLAILATDGSKPRPFAHVAECLPTDRRSATTIVQRLRRKGLIRLVGKAGWALVRQRSRRDVRENT